MSQRDEPLTAELAFARLEQLRELLRLVSHLREHQPEKPDPRAAPTPEPPTRGARGAQKTKRPTKNRGSQPAGAKPP